MPQAENSVSKQQRPLAQMAAEFHPRRLLPSLTAGIIVGLLEIVLALSFAALIFAGPLAGYVANGVGLALMAAAVSGLVVALLTTLPGTVSGNQDAPAAVMAVMSAGVVAFLGAGVPAEVTFVTVALTIALTTTLTGICFFALGHFQLGNLVRFLPYPVVGGFLAGTGWLLVSGAVNLLAGTSAWRALLRPEILLQWLPGLLFALAVLFILGRFDRFWILPAMLIGAVALFYAVVWAAGVSLEQLNAQGWLLGPFPTTSLWRPYAWEGLRLVQWSALWPQLPNIAILVLLSTVALLLNATGLEAAVARDVSLNRELRAAGVANVVAGLAGGLVGFQQLSLSVLGMKMGAVTRLAGVIASLLCLITLFVGAAFLSLVPKVVVGGLLLFLGLSFLKAWVYDTWFRLPRVEYAIIVFILLIIGAVGFLEGVAVGVVAAIILFTVAYSQIDVVRHELTGRHVASRVTRTPAAQRYLREQGGRLYILQLQGFIFFGTADRLLNQVRERMETAERPQFVLLDLRRVTGLDTTAAQSLIRLRQAVADQGAHLLLTEASPTTRKQLEKGGLAADDSVHFFPRLDQGVEWCENQLLAEAAAAVAEAPETLAAQLATILSDTADVQALLPYLERQHIDAGGYLMVQGEAPENLYFLESGQVTAQLEYPDRAPVRLESVGSGRVVGEIGFYLGKTRTASVVADVPCVVYRLTRRQLAQMEAEAPQAASALHRLIALLLSERVTHLVSTVNALEQ